MSEEKLQQSCVIWFNNNYCLKHHNPQYCIFSVPNGGLRTKREAMKLKLTGLRAGVSDLIVVLNKKVLFIELKIEDGRQSIVQFEFDNIVKKLNHKYYLIYSLEEFKNAIEYELS